MVYLSGQLCPTHLDSVSVVHLLPSILSCIFVSVWIEGSWSSCPPLGVFRHGVKSDRKLPVCCNCWGTFLCCFQIIWETAEALFQIDETIVNKTFQNVNRAT